MGAPVEAGAPIVPFPMVTYLVRRIVWAVFVMLAVTALTFAIFYLLPPGDPALRFVGKQPTPQKHRARPPQPWPRQAGGVGGSR